MVPTGGIANGLIYVGAPIPGDISPQPERAARIGLNNKTFNFNIIKLGQFVCDRVKCLAGEQDQDQFGSFVSSDITTSFPQPGQV
jgi:hypothetical protein